MGASNALRAYAAWGPVLDDRPMRLLIYMALIARDGDAAPWYGLGHEALAEIGAVFGITREMVRQDLLPWTPPPPQTARVRGARFAKASACAGILAIQVGKRRVYLTRAEAAQLADVITRWEDTTSPQGGTS